MFKVKVCFLREEEMVGELPWGAESYSGTNDPLGKLDDLEMRERAVENEFWVTNETTFEELYNDAVRYFVHEDLRCVRGSLYNGRLCEWQKNGKVLSYLSASPSDELRRIVLKVRGAELWQQNDHCDESDCNIQSSAGKDKEVTTLDQLTETKLDSLGYTPAVVQQKAHETIRGIYSAYCLHGNRSEEVGISLQDMHRFVNDCKLDLARERVTIACVSEKEKGYDGFLNVILNLAHMKYPLDSKMDAMEKFIERHVAPHSSKWDQCEFDYYPGEVFFAGLERTVPVKSILRKFSVPLRHIFQAYCLCDPSARTGSDIKFLNLNQFQLFIQDFELFSLGAYLDARLCARIYLTTCDFHGTDENYLPRCEDTSNKPGGGGPKMLFDKFVQAVYRLSVVLAIPFRSKNTKIDNPDSRHQARRYNKTRYKCVAKALAGNPSLCFKAFLQHMHFNVFGRSYKLKGLCRKIENRHWRKGNVTPLGSQTDITSCATSLAKEFNKIWTLDGAPEDYFSIIEEQIEEKEAEKRYEYSVAMNGQAAVHVEPLKAICNPKQIEAPKKEEEETTDKAQGLANPSDENARRLCRTAEASFEKTANMFTNLLAKLACTSDTRVVSSFRQINIQKEVDKPNLTMDSIMAAYEEARLQYSAIVRGSEDAIERHHIQWRWGVSLLGVATRILSRMSNIFESDQGGMPSCWLSGTWTPLRESSRSPEACGNYLRLCEFARACLEQADAKFKMVALYLVAVEARVEVACEVEYKLALDRASMYRLAAQVRAIMLRIRIARAGEDKNKKTKEEIVHFFRNITKVALDIDFCLSKAAGFYEKVRFSRYFRLPLLNNWSFVLFERALSKATAFHTRSQSELLLGKPLCARKAKTQLLSVSEDLQRAREIAALGFELEINTPSSKEWFTPIALLWLWGNCIDIGRLVGSNIERIFPAEQSIKRVDSASMLQKFQRNLVHVHVHDPKNIFQFEHSQLFTPNAVATVTEIFEKFDKKKLGSLGRQELDELCRIGFCWDKNGFYKSLVWAQMKKYGRSTLTKARFSSFLMFLALTDPQGFVKLVWSCEALGRFGFKAKSGYFRKRVPTGMLVTSMLYQSFESTSPRQRLRRMHNLKRIKTPSPLMFLPGYEDEESESIHEQGGTKIPITTVSMSAEYKFVDYFVVFDARELDTMADLENINTPEKLPLKPKMRSVWPPTVDDILQVDEHGFSAQDLASIRLLNKVAPLPEDLLAFCFADASHHLSGIPNDSPEDVENVRKPVLNRFVLTDSAGIRRYGLIMTFQEETDLACIVSGLMENGPAIISSGRDKKWFAPTSLCILSRWPFFATFEKILLQTLRLVRSESLPCPIERYLVNVISETPVPPRGEAQVQVVLGDLPIYIRRPPKNELPLVDFSFRPLLELLSDETILFVFCCLLQEQKVTLCAADETRLTCIAEIFRSLLFPFDLQCIYIPLLPSALSDFLYAPVPFFMGLNSTFISSCETGYDSGNISSGPDEFDEDYEEFESAGVTDEEGKQHTRQSRDSKRARQLRTPGRVVSIDIEPRDVVFIDLDQDKILLPLQQNKKPLQTAKLPKLLSRKLAESLKKARDGMPISSDPYEEFDGVSGKIDFGKYSTPESRTLHAHTSSESSMSQVPKQPNYEEHEQWAKDLRSGFAQFHVRLLRNYKKYFARRKQDIDWGFDRNGFLADHASTREFCKELFNTQLFECFLRDVVVSLNGQTTERQDELQLFDELIVEKENKSKAGRIYSRQKRQPTPLLSSTMGTIARTVFVEMPELANNHGVYSYTHFPQLDVKKMRSTLNPSSISAGEAERPIVVVDMLEREIRWLHNENDHDHNKDTN
mmetsp:Transcript_44265/g.70745  ORF Transcript_44265/g.70745 Transcript_44265/m.70745 type:complete len:1835 (+) Transcript_44265:455-5959(+)|eukprot:CAMPEP_0203744686 /NCGR_PEP_ID=MMETSP0098-20131031/671_1 /ASSEMBLY_ACC=CAM_ASM_000208 /TAXON_ID=96639 /ORGANISM=" , Strain NY0313808BC1" /LENGTH=1834 /DNA_ID=CAMNT_0050632271 /DNA_START=311 /DNA_END=5815 /DNA_ORIENTATION=-